MQPNNSYFHLFPFPAQVLNCSVYASKEREPDGIYWSVLPIIYIFYKMNVLCATVAGVT